MNIHEHQAKEILKKFNIKILKGFTIFSLEEIEKKYKTLKTKKVALKAQIHAGGRGKAGGIKIVNDIELEDLREYHFSIIGNLKLSTPTSLI